MKHLLLLLLLSPFVVKAQTITTIAGTGVWSCSGDGGAAVGAAVGQLSSVATDTSGNVYIGCGNCRKVKKISTSGIITTFAGTGIGGSSGDGGPASAANIGLPSALAADRYGNVYIADGDNSVIRKVNAAGIISTIAGDAGVIGGGYSGDGGPATAALLNYPQGIAADSAGNLYISDNGNYVIRKIATTGIITRIAGTGSWSYSGDGGPAISASIQSPRGIAVDRSGNVYFTDNYNSRVRKINPAGNISLFAGNGINGYSGNGGPATAAAMSYPDGLATDRYGNLYIADEHNNVVRKVTASGIITTNAGNGTSGHSGDGGPAFAAQLNYPQGIAIDKNGYKYIAELNGAYLRKTDSCTAPWVAPITGDTLLCAGDTIALADVVPGGVWTVSDTSIGAINAAGVLIGMTKGAVVVTYTITNACAAMFATRQETVGPYAGAIHSMNGWHGASGVDTFCYDAYLYVTGAIGGVWGLTDTTLATISATGNVMPFTYNISDTAFYAVTDSCGTDTAFFPLYILWCPDNVPHVAAGTNDARIFPNPANDIVHITATDAMEYVITGIAGNIVLRGNLRAGENSVSVAHLPAGLYCITTTAANGTRYVVKLQKE